MNVLGGAGGRCERRRGAPPSRSPARLRHTWRNSCGGWRCSCDHTCTEAHRHVRWAGRPIEKATWRCLRVVLSRGDTARRARARVAHLLCAGRAVDQAWISAEKKATQRDAKWSPNGLRSSIERRARLGGPMGYRGCREVEKSLVWGAILTQLIGIEVK